MPNKPPLGVKENDSLAVYWDQPVSHLARVDLDAITPELAERHRIYSLLTMALVDAYWNGNKNGPDGDYPWRPSARKDDGSYRGDRFGDRYIGHNIACIAVDENGEIIDFEFNHNELFNSSAEHAEARLIRRIFSLNQAYDHWQTLAQTDLREISYGNVFNGVTIYTSLESCAQCSGVMTLASCQRVVYLQTDPGQYLVGNILYNLSRPQPQPKVLALDAAPRPNPSSKYWAPEPVNASEFGFGFKEELDRAYLKYLEEGAKNPDTRYFWKKGNVTKKAEGLTSFLCTDLAKDIYDRAAQEFQEAKLDFAAFQPPRSDGRTDGVRSNADALAHARAFLAHAVKEARRGTPHR